MLARGPRPRSGRDPVEHAYPTAKRLRLFISRISTLQERFTRPRKSWGNALVLSRQPAMEHIPRRPSLGQTYSRLGPNRIDHSSASQATARSRRFGIILGRANQRQRGQA